MKKNIQTVVHNTSNDNFNPLSILAEIFDDMDHVRVGMNTDRLRIVKEMGPKNEQSNRYREEIEFVIHNGTMICSFYIRNIGRMNEVDSGLVANKCRTITIRVPKTLVAAETVRDELYDMCWEHMNVKTRKRQGWLTAIRRKRAG